MATTRDLAELLHSIDGRGYGAYRKAKGAWSGPDFTFHLDYVQGDPYATPSRARFHLPPGAHAIPDAAWSSRPRRVGLCDFLLRAFRAACDRLPRVPGSGRSGEVRVSVDSPRVVERAGCRIDGEGLTLRFRVGLPAGGRSCFGHSAAELLTGHLPEALDAVRWEELDRERAWSWIRTTEDHARLQEGLAARGLVAFVADGAVLPRKTGVSSEPLPDAVPFESPPELRVSLETPHRGEIEGMGIPEGVTVITGGGFHGKTTVVEAIQSGVVPHAPGDGRERVAAVPDAVQVRSEDGRAVTGVNLSPFVRDLPGDRDTARFTSPDASGSTSLAADLMEALEVGTSLILMDEDTCATNLLVRDARMQALVRKETLTPLIDRVREMHRELGVSTVLVTGGSGDYLDVADTIVLMEDYLPRDAGVEAREVARAHPTDRRVGDPDTPLRVAHRVPHGAGFDPRKRSGKVRIRTRGTDRIEFGTETIELVAVEQLVDYGETRAVGDMLREMGALCDGRKTLRELCHAVVAKARREGLAAIDDSPELALPRPQEVMKAASRLRSLEVLEVREAAGREEVPLTSASHDRGRSAREER